MDLIHIKLTSQHKKGGDNVVTLYRLVLGEMAFTMTMLIICNKGQNEEYTPTCKWVLFSVCKQTAIPISGHGSQKLGYNRTRLSMH